MSNEEEETSKSQIQECMDFADKWFYQYTDQKLLRDPKIVDVYHRRGLIEYREVDQYVDESHYSINYDLLPKVLKQYVWITKNISNLTHEFNVYFPHLRNHSNNTAHFVEKFSGWDFSDQPMYLYRVLDAENKTRLCKWISDSIKNSCEIKEVYFL